MVVSTYLWHGIGLYADSTLYWLDDASSTANYLIWRRCMRLLLDDDDRSFIGDGGGEIRTCQPLAMMYLVSTGSRALSRLVGALHITRQLHWTSLLPAVISEVP